MIIIITKRYIDRKSNDRNWWGQFCNDIHADTHATTNNSVTERNNNDNKRSDANDQNGKGIPVNERPCLKAILLFGNPKVCVLSWMFTQGIDKHIYLWILDRY